MNVHAEGGGLTSGECFFFLRKLEAIESRLEAIASRLEAHLV